jgi:hypothetical protein
LPKKYKLGKWIWTFGSSIDCDWLTIHRYKECPSWFGESWLPKAE